MPMDRLQRVATVFKIIENAINRGMTDWPALFVMQQILLADIGNIAVLGVFGEQMVKWLILARPHFGRDGLIPFLRIVENRINVKNHPPKIKHPVPHNLTNAKGSPCDRRGVSRMRAVSAIQYMCHATEIGCRNPLGKRYSFG